MLSKLSKYLPVITNTKHDQFILEIFAIMIFDRSSPTTSIGDARLDLFARKQKSYKSIPPTCGALTEHTIKQDALGGQATICNMEEESPGDWGRKNNCDMRVIIWTILPLTAESYQQLTKCACKT
jgi:hypothetical protein